MAISGIVNLLHSGVHACDKPAQTAQATDLGRRSVAALSITDTLVGIAAVVLGVLAMLGILPLPAGWGQAFAYGAIVGGIVNILASLRNTYRGGQDLAKDCCSSKGQITA